MMLHRHQPTVLLQNQMQLQRLTPVQIMYLTILTFTVSQTESEMHYVKVVCTLTVTCLTC
jgi:hypothetical protein